MVITMVITSITRVITDVIVRKCSYGVAGFISG